MDSNTLDATHHADGAIKFLDFHKIEAIPHVLPSSPDPARTILDHVHRLGAAMLVMGAYGQPICAEFFVRSITPPPC